MFLIAYSLYSHHIEPLLKHSLQTNKKQKGESSTQIDTTLLYSVLNAKEDQLWYLVAAIIFPLFPHLKNAAHFINILLIFPSSIN